MKGRDKAGIWPSDLARMRKRCRGIVAQQRTSHRFECLGNRGFDRRAQMVRQAKRLSAHCDDYGGAGYALVEVQRQPEQRRWIQMMGEDARIGRAHV